MWRKWRLVSAVAVLTLSACTQPPPVLLKNVQIGDDGDYGLVTDVRRSGTAAEKKVWQAELDLQQANAANKAAELAVLKKQLEASQRLIEALTEEIKKIK